MQQAPRPCRDAGIELHIKIKFRRQVWPYFEDSTLAGVGWELKPRRGSAEGISTEIR
jgi:hypothetical protein